MCHFFKKDCNINKYFFKKQVNTLEDNPSKMATDLSPQEMEFVKKIVSLMLLSIVG